MVEGKLIEFWMQLENGYTNTNANLLFLERFILRLKNA